MKRFEFTLEKAKRYREAQLQMEEARYSMLSASLASIEHRMRELDSAHLEQRVALSRNTGFDGAELERLHEFGEFVSVELRRLAREQDALRQELAAQAAKLAEFRQKVELLEKLKTKEVQRWNQESGRELQLAAEESFNARWLRERQR